MNCHDYALIGGQRVQMRKLNAKGLMVSSLIALMGATTALAQNSSPKPTEPPEKIEDNLLASIGVPQPKLTPLAPVSKIDSLPVKLLYDGPKLDGSFLLEITLSKADRDSQSATQLISQSTLHLKMIEPEIDALLNLTEAIDDLQIEANLRDINGNLVLKTSHPIPVVSQDLRVLRLMPLSLPELTPYVAPDFTSVELITGQAVLPPKTRVPLGATLHVQLLENALAGGLSMELIAQDSRPIQFEDGQLNFSLQRGLWDRQDTPDLSFKAWITDRDGRKIFVMNDTAGYNGPDIEYSIRLESIKQGKDTKRGLTLPADLMAQTLVQGEAIFDPVNGIPGGARLKIQLKQDRGDFNINPILAEQTLLLRQLETRIPFTLTTDSTHFDPYAPAPFLSVAITDSHGRIYYTSGDIRAREDRNLIRLFPR